MNPRIKNTASTLGLVLFLAVAIYVRFQWLSLIIPGAILIWYGFVAASRRQRIGMRKTGQSGLH